MPKVSVIVPVYNAEKTLRETITSILAQTYKDFELILVDDGSPDKSGEICDELAGIDIRIRVIHQKNTGVASARNNGVKNANGELITFLDADDLWSLQFLEKMVATYESHITGTPGIAFVFCGLRIITSKSEKIVGNSTGKEFKIIGRDYFYNFVYKGIEPSSDSILIPRKIFELSGGFKQGLKTGEDIFFWTKLSLMGMVVFIDEILATYRADIIDWNLKPRVTTTCQTHFYSHLKDYLPEYRKNPEFVNYFEFLVLAYGRPYYGKSKDWSKSIRGLVAEIQNSQWRKSVGFWPAVMYRIGYSFPPMLGRRFFRICREIEKTISKLKRKH